MSATLSAVAVKTSAPAVVDWTVKVAMPEPSVVADAGAMTGVPGPEVLASVTSLPDRGLLSPFFTVTVIVEVVVPSATTEVGEADTVELAALTAAERKVTVAVCVTVTLSVVSVAVKTGEPAVEDFTVNVTTPEPLETPEAAEIVSVAPRLEASVTVLPGTAALVASFRVTVIVDSVAPSLATVVGLATTVEVAASAREGAAA